MVATLQKKKISWYQKEVSLCNEGTDPPPSNSDSGRISKSEKSYRQKTGADTTRKERDWKMIILDGRGSEKEGKKVSIIDPRAVSPSSNSVCIPPPIFSQPPPHSRASNFTTTTTQNRGGGDWNWGGETQEFKDLQG